MTKAFYQIYGLLPDGSRTSFWLVMLSALVSAILDAGFIGATIIFLNMVLTQGDSSFTFLSIFDSFWPYSRQSLLLILFFLFSFLLSLGRAFLIYYSVSVANMIEKQLTDNIFNEILVQPPYLIGNSEPSELAKKILADVNTFIGLSLSPLFTLVTAVFTIVAILGVLLLEDARILVLILPLAIFFLIVNGASQRLGAIYGERRVRAQSHRYKVIFTSLQAHKDIVINRLFSWVSMDFFSATLEFARSSSVAVFLSQVPRVVIEFSVVMVAVGGFVFTTLNEVPLPSTEAIGALALGLVRLLPSVSALLSSLTSLSVGSANLYDLRALTVQYCGSNLVADKEILNARNTDSEPTDSSVETRLIAECRSIYFGYETNKPLRSLAGFSKQFRAGVWYAVIGPSGSGKSTLLDILGGLGDPDYLLGDVNVHIPRSLISYVIQDGAFFSASIATNICLDRERKDDRIFEILNDLELAESVRRAGGLDCTMSGMTQRFSGGQLQRLLLARALYGSPSLLLLDEVTSALDSASCRLVFDAVRKWVPDATCLWVTHSQVVVDECDEVIEFEL